MFEQILKSLKTKYKNLGLSDEYLKVIAKRLARTVKEENEIEEAVADLEDEMKFQQSQNDVIRTLKTQMAKSNQQSANGEKQEAKSEPQSADSEPQKEEEIPAWAKALIDSNKQLNERLSQAEAEKTQQSNEQKLISKLKELGVSEHFYSLQITGKTFENDEQINQFAQSIKDNETAYLQATNNSLLGKQEPPKFGGKVKEYEEQIKQIEQTKQELKNEIIKDVLQTDAKDLASQFGDALVDAFEKGENAAKSLDSVSKNVFKNMMKNALNMQLEKQMQPVLDRLLADVGFDTNGNGSFRSLTAQQIEQYKEIFRNTTMQYSQFAQEIAKVTSDVANQDSLKGAIQGMSEETAGVLAGQFNAIRINTGELVKNSGFSLEAMQNAVGQLVKIEQNTYNLHQMRKDLAELNTKVSGGDTLRAKGF